MTERGKHKSGVCGEVEREAYATERQTSSFSSVVVCSIVSLTPGTVTIATAGGELREENRCRKERDLTDSATENSELFLG